MDLFTSLGFHWTRDAVPDTLPTHSRERVCFRFHRMLPEFVWDASMLEGNPFTFPEVKTLLDGVTVGGRRLSDQDQVLNLAESSRHLLGLVRSGTFAPDKPTFCTLQGIVARKEALEWGHFRGEGNETAYTPDVGLGAHGRYTVSLRQISMTAPVGSGRSGEGEGATRHLRTCVRTPQPLPCSHARRTPQPEPPPPRHHRG